MSLVRCLCLWGSPLILNQLLMQNESSEASERPIREVSQPEADMYEAQLKEFQRLFNHQPSLQASDEDTYYLVSVRFLNTWRDFCLSQEQQRHLPVTLNEDLLEGGRLREGLVEGADFEVVSKAVWEALGEWRANELRRQVVVLGHERRVPIYLNEYRYLTITATQVKDIQRLAKRKDAFQLRRVEASENATVEQLVSIILAQEDYPHCKGRLWKVSESVESFLTHVQRSLEKMYSMMQIRIKGFGKKLEEERRLEEVEIGPDDFLLVEMKEKDRKWFLEAEGEKQCEGCYDFTVLRFPCKCNNVHYCSEACREKDKHYHMRRCEFAEMEEFRKSFRMEAGEGSRRGRVGLRNLGNTCFMNSCLQCLSNTRPLTQYFLQRLFEAEINRTNPLGTKGKLARNYAMFIKAMWCDRESVFSPDFIKSAVSSINPMFSGYAQHDSQEFFSFLIDGLHEDLNRVEKKPYVPAIESAGRSDADVAAESWLAHIRRNQSVITDLMTGQYKSKVTCPTCHKESITFDPFITVTLPISEVASNNFECFVFRSDFQERTRKINFTYGKASLADWRRAISKITGLEEHSLQIYLVSIYEGIYLAGRDSLADIVFKMENENKNVFVFELSEEEQRMADRIDLPVRLSKKTYFHSSEYENLWFKFPLWFQPSSTGLDIYRRVLRFLFPTAFIKRPSSPPADYAAYEALMLQKRPFKLVMKHDRRVDRHYSRLQHRYGAEVDVGDECTLQQLWENIDSKECELDVRFTEAGLSLFELKNLKDYDDCCNSKKGSSRYEEAPSSAVELRDCFTNLSEEEELQRGNQWYCPQCKEHKQARKVIQIYKAPKILILHLKRFKNKGSYRKEKNETRVHFPETLDMAPFLIDSAPPASYSLHPAVSQAIIPPKHQGPATFPSSQSPIYDLYAVSNHYGGLGGGHYTAYAKNGGSWLDFNDSSVREVSRQSIQGSSAYILFYSRRDE